MVIYEFIHYYHLVSETPLRPKNILKVIQKFLQSLR